MIMIIMRRRRLRRETSPDRSGAFGWSLAAAAVASPHVHGFYRSQFGDGIVPRTRPSAMAGMGRAKTLGGALWLWTKKLLAVSFMASMIAVGQYFYTHFTKKWETEGLPQMPITGIRGPGDARAGGSGASGNLLGGPSTNTSANTQVRPGRQMNYEEYKD